jgi:lipopolysaccharide/colanic/teichoic acid biosynthesis glycosyltransferase
MTDRALGLSPSSVEWPAPRGVVSGQAPVTATFRVPAWEEPVRTALDCVGALLTLVVLLPLLLVVALWVRLDSPGPALLRQPRIGRGGRTFTLYKFRTMRVACDDHAHRALIQAELSGTATLREGSTKVPHDSRVTRAGRILRRTSLDELPQLINVLKGDMSLVGPRPCLTWEAALFPAEFKDRFSVRPGITGLWQVRGRSTLGTLDMLRLDMEYVRTRRLLGDVEILLVTVPSMLRGDGAR